MVAQYGNINTAYNCKNEILNLREDAYVSTTMHLLSPSEVSTTLYSCIMELENQYYHLQVWGPGAGEVDLFAAWGKTLLRLHVEVLVSFFIFGLTSPALDWLNPTDVIASSHSLITTTES